MNSGDISKEIGTDSVAFLWRFGSAEFDEGQMQLRVAGQKVELQLKPLEVLLYLLRHAGEVVTKDELLESVWPGVIVVEAVLTNAITKLRKALADDDQHIIATLHRIGYRVIADVQRKPIVLSPDLHWTFKAGDMVPRRESWQLLRPLSELGQSEVWLAVHAKTAEQRVFKFSTDGRRLSSLKREVTLNRLMMQSLPSERRFVRVLEWNFDALPFFVECEYGGQNLLDWATGLPDGLAALPLQQRLALAVQIADATAAAHSVGVLHKDLKPANILINSSPSSAWQIRLTDFGSGRTTDPEVLARLNITQLGFTQTQNIDADSSSGTPLYLAPEILAGHLPTLQADIYALGVIAYQLVVADLRRPMSPGWEQSVSDPLLAADLSKAANGDPQQRFVSAAMFAEQLRSLSRRRELLVLEHAQQARLEQQLLALRRARARRPWLIALAIVLAIGVGISYWFFNRALRFAQVASESGTFLVHDVLGAGNPYQSGQRDITMREVLDRAAARAPQAFRNMPMVAEDIHNELAWAYRAIGEPELSLQQFKLSLQSAEAAYGADSEDTQTKKIALVMQLCNVGQLDTAQSLVDLIRKQGAAGAKIAAQLDFADGRIALDRPDYPRAIKYLQRAYDSHQMKGWDMSPLAMAYAGGGHWAEANALFMDGINTSIHENGIDHPTTVRLQLERLQQIAWNAPQGTISTDDAAAIVQQGVKTLTANDPVMLSSRLALAELYRQNNKLPEARTQWQIAVEWARTNHIDGPQIEAVRAELKKPLNP